MQEYNIQCLFGGGEKTFLVPPKQKQASSEATTRELQRQDWTSLLTIVNLTRTQKVFLFIGSYMAIDILKYQTYTLVAPQSTIWCENQNHTEIKNVLFLS